MRATFLLWSVLITHYIWGQQIYSSQHPAYKENHYSLTLHLYNDSSCYIKGHYKDNASYFIYKGRIKKVNDTLYDLRFQPLVSFGCNKAYHTQDSVKIMFEETDTILPTLLFTVKNQIGISQNVDLTVNRKRIEEAKGVSFSTAYIKGIDNKPFHFDTKYMDPITKKKIIMNIHETSGPDLTYYGSHTPFVTIQLVAGRNKWTMYPDEKHCFFQEKEILIKTKQ